MFAKFRVPAFLMISAFVAFFQAIAMDSDSDSTMKVTRHYGIMSAGISWFTNSNLNDYLNRLGFSSFKEYAVSVSLGSHSEVGNMVMENAITGNFWEDKINSGLRSTLWSADIFMNSGYNIFASEMPMSLFPYMGFGIGLNTLQIRSDTKTLPQLIVSKEPDAFLWQPSILFDLGIGSDAIFTMADKKQGLTIGFRAGYTYDIYTAQNWYSDGTSISDVPRFRQNGGYVRIILGAWGSHKHMDHHSDMHHTGA